MKNKSLNPWRDEFKGKVAIVTGGAHGIGRVVAETFVQTGMSVVIADIDQERGAKVAEKFLPQALFVPCDLGNEKDIERLVEKTRRHFKRIDLIFNNARPKLRSVPFTESFAEWDLALDVFLKAPALLAKYALADLMKSKGTIINMTSSNSYCVSQQPVAYHVAKAGITQLTRYLAYEFGPYGIRVNAICPALVDIQDENKDPLTKDPVNKEVVEQIVPLQRAASPEDIARTAFFLASEVSSYMTGQTIMLEGGMTLGEPFRAARKAYLAGRKKGPKDGK